MKTTILTFVALCMTIFTFGQAVQRNMVVMETGTCTNVVYSSGEAMGENDLLTNGCQVAVIDYHFNAWGVYEPFANAASIARVSYYGMWGFPTTFFDGVLSFIGGNPSLSMYPIYLPLYIQRYAALSPLTICMSGSNIGNTYTVNIMVRKVAPISATNLKLQLVLTESNIAYEYFNQTVLNHVERAMVPDENGTTVDFSSGDIQNYVLTFTKDSTWVANNCELIAFIQDNDSKECLNGIKSSLTSSPFTGTCNYCLPSYSVGCTVGNGLTLFQMNTISQTIPCTGSPSWYHDFTNLSTNLSFGNTHTITMQAGYPDTYVDVWTDYDHNGIFDETELVGQTICYTTGTNYSINFTVPSTVLTGSTRMRVMTELNSYPTGPCTSQTYGNCSDFTVNIHHRPPTVLTMAATNIGLTSATLHGTVNANGTNTNVFFDYGLGLKPGIPATVNGDTLVADSLILTDLIPGTTYNYHFDGFTDGGISYGNEMTFTTKKYTNEGYCVPYYTSGCGWGDGVTLFQLNSINQDINCSGDSPWYHDFTPLSTNLLNGSPNTITLQVGYDDTFVNIYIDYDHNNVFDSSELIGQVHGLSTNTNYTITFTVPGNALSGNTCLRAVTNWNSYPSGPCATQDYGNCSDFTVNILNLPPTVATTSASNVGPASVTLNGTVNANGSSTNVSFQYGLTTSYGSTVAGVPATVNGTATTNVSAAINGLSCGTLYHYRAVGVNNIGTTYGNDMIFSTDGTQIPSITLTPIPSNNTYTGGVPTTLYLGYGPQSVTLSASATGGSGFTYSWIATPLGLAGLSCTTCANPVFTPTEEGRYIFTLTVTNSAGCSSTTSITICVLDIRVPGQNNKVYVCHNQGKPQTKSVNVNAVPSHVPGHPQDYLGECDQSCNNLEYKNIEITGDPIVSTNNTFSTIIYPNPFTSDFTVIVKTDSQESISMNIYDLTGRLLQEVKNIKPNTPVIITNDLADGFYVLKIHQRSQDQNVKIIKNR